MSRRAKQRESWKGVIRSRIIGDFVMGSGILDSYGELPLRPLRPGD